MKKFVLFILLLLLALPAGCAEKPDYTISPGTYSEEGILGGSICFYPKLDQFFSFYYSPLLSSGQSGRYECRDGKVYCYATNMDVTQLYVFRIVDDEALVFLQDESSPLPQEDGAQFRLEHLMTAEEEEKYYESIHLPGWSTASPGPSDLSPFNPSPEE